MADNTQLTPRKQDPDEVAQVPPTINPEDIFSLIEAIARRKDELPPGFIRRLLAPDENEALRAIEEAKEVQTQEVEAIQKYIRDLYDRVEIYVKAHGEGLHLIQPTTFLATFAQLREAMLKAIENSPATFWDTFSNSVTRIRANDILTDDQKAEQLEKTYQRFKQAQKQHDEAFDELLAQVQDQANKLLASGQTPDRPAI